MSTIRLREVSKRYADGAEAVRGLDLQIGDGEFMILVGPSGCGKSTALRMIAGLEEISDGELFIGSERVNDLAPKDRDVAMVFQSYALYPHMSVRENMGFALRLRKVASAEIDRRVREAAEILDLGDHLDRKPANLSGGQRQRVAMGRAIVREPKAFLMDEPLSNLDAKLRVEMRTAVSRLQHRLGATTVYVTHDQTEAMTLGDRVAVMRSGVLQQVGSPRELYDRPCNVFVAGFIGSPAMNFLPGAIEGDAVSTPLGAIPLDPELRQALERRPAGSSDVLVGIRPEAFEDAELTAADDERWPFAVAVDVVESMGSDLYVHFDAGGDDLRAPGLRELAEDAGTGEVPRSGAPGHAVARVDPASGIVAGGRARLRLDPRRLHLFDPADGRAIASSRAGEPRRRAAP